MSVSAPVSVPVSVPVSLTVSVPLGARASGPPLTVGTVYHGRNGVFVRVPVRARVGARARVRAGGLVGLYISGGMGMPSRGSRISATVAAKRRKTARRRARVASSGACRTGCSW